MKLLRFRVVSSWRCSHRAEKIRVGLEGTLVGIEEDIQKCRDIISHGYKIRKPGDYIARWQIDSTLGQLFKGETSSPLARKEQVAMPAPSQSYSLLTVPEHFAQDDQSPDQNAVVHAERHQVWYSYHTRVTFEEETPDTELEKRKKKYLERILMKLFSQTVGKRLVKMAFTTDREKLGFNPEHGRVNVASWSLESDGSGSSEEIPAMQVYLHPYFLTLSEDDGLIILHQPIISCLYGRISDISESLARTEEYARSIDRELPSDARQQKSVHVEKVMLDASVDTVAVETWVQMNPSKYQGLLKFLARHMRYVPEGEFLAELERRVREFNAAIGDTPYVLITFGGVDRSAYYTYRHALRLGLNSPAAIFDIAFDTQTRIREFLSERSDISDVLVLEDFSLTGQQMKRGAISNVAKLSHKIDRALSVHVVIPFTTRLARYALRASTLKNSGFILYDSQHIESVSGEMYRELSLEKYLEYRGLLREYLDLRRHKFRPWVHKILTHFGHKYPDEATMLTFYNHRDSRLPKIPILQGPVRGRSDDEYTYCVGLVPWAFTSPYKTEYRATLNELVEDRTWASRVKQGKAYRHFDVDARVPLLPATYTSGGGNSFPISPLDDCTIESFRAGLDTVDYDADNWTQHLENMKRTYSELQRLTTEELRYIGWRIADFTDYPVFHLVDLVAEKGIVLPYDHARAIVTTLPSLEQEKLRPEAGSSPVGERNQSALPILPSNNRNIQPNRLSSPAINGYEVPAAIFGNGVGSSPLSFNRISDLIKLGFAHNISPNPIEAAVLPLSEVAGRGTRQLRTISTQISTPLSGIVTERPSISSILFITPAFAQATQTEQSTEQPTQDTILGMDTTTFVVIAGTMLTILAVMSIEILSGRKDRAAARRLQVQPPHRAIERALRSVTEKKTPKQQRDPEEERIRAEERKLRREAKRCKRLTRERRKRSRQSRRRRSSSPIQATTQSSQIDFSNAMLLSDRGRIEGAINPVEAAVVATPALSSSLDLINLEKRTGSSPTVAGTRGVNHPENLVASTPVVTGTLEGEIFNRTSARLFGYGKEARIGKGNGHVKTRKPLDVTELRNGHRHPNHSRIARAGFKTGSLEGNISSPAESENAMVASSPADNRELAGRIRAALAEVRHIREYQKDPAEALKLLQGLREPLRNLKHREVQFFSKEALYFLNKIASGEIDREVSLGALQTLEPLLRDFSGIEAVRTRETREFFVSSTRIANIYRSEVTDEIQGSQEYEDGEEREEGLNWDLVIGNLEIAEEVLVAAKDLLLYLLRQYRDVDFLTRQAEFIVSGFLNVSLEYAKLIAYDLGYVERTNATLEAAEEMVDDELFEIRDGEDERIIQDKENLEKQIEYIISGKVSFARAVRRYYWDVEHFDVEDFNLDDLSDGLDELEDGLLYFRPNDDIEEVKEQEGFLIEEYLRYAQLLVEYSDRFQEEDEDPELIEEIDEAASRAFSEAADLLDGAEEIDRETVELFLELKGEFDEGSASSPSDADLGPGRISIVVRAAEIKQIVSLMELIRAALDDFRSAVASEEWLRVSEIGQGLEATINEYSERKPSFIKTLIRTITRGGVTIPSPRGRGEVFNLTSVDIRNGVIMLIGGYADPLILDSGKVRYIERLENLFSPDSDVSKRLKNIFALLEVIKKKKRAILVNVYGEIYIDVEKTLEMGGGAVSSSPLRITNNRVFTAVLLLVLPAGTFLGIAIKETWSMSRKDDTQRLTAIEDSIAPQNGDTGVGQSRAPPAGEFAIDQPTEIPTHVPVETKLNIPEQKPGDLSQHFSRSEFTCNHCGELPQSGIHKGLVRKLEQLHSRLSERYSDDGIVEIVISSGYRCPDWNEHEGGTKTSQHLYGMAADFEARVVDASNREKVLFVIPRSVVLPIVESVKFKKVIAEHPTTNYIHVDMRGSSPINFSIATLPAYRGRLQGVQPSSSQMRTQLTERKLQSEFDPALISLTILDGTLRVFMRINRFINNQVLVVKLVLGGIHAATYVPISRALITTPVSRRALEGDNSASSPALNRFQRISIWIVVFLSAMVNGLAGFILIDEWQRDPQETYTTEAAETDAAKLQELTGRLVGLDDPIAEFN
ncbi:D-Ala-D-Ala carboxypeptidase family metallohydrolase, partial [Thermoproteota archaeon]